MITLLKTLGSQFREKKGIFKYTGGREEGIVVLNVFLIFQIRPVEAVQFWFEYIKFLHDFLVQAHIPL